MNSVETSLSQVLELAHTLPVENRPTRDCLGLVLAEDIVSDIHSPPHDKSTVDGYAIMTQDLVDGIACLTLLEEVAAGALPAHPLIQGTTSRIFTGAPIPENTDAVVMIERAELIEERGLQRVRLTDPHIRAGSNIMRRGQSLRCDEVVLRRGQTIRAIEIGLLAEVGRTEVVVHRRPHVAVLATGNELVPVDRHPGPGQIRNSNSSLLCALVREAGGEPIDLQIAPDEETELRRLVERGLEYDVLVLSGGVSAGAYDLVPKVLDAVGVKQVFHKVNLKPGKPIWFGSTPEHGVSQWGDRTRLVFGLPGNPVSSLVCFELFVRPALKKMLARTDWTLSVGHGRLTTNFRHRGDRPTYYPAITRQEVFQATARGAGLRVELLDWQGSADLKTLAAANSLAYFPSGDHAYAAGDEITMYWLN